MAKLPDIALSEEDRITTYRAGWDAYLNNLGRPNFKSIKEKAAWLSGYEGSRIEATRPKTSGDMTRADIEATSQLLKGSFQRLV